MVQAVWSTAHGRPLENTTARAASRSSDSGDTSIRSSRARAAVGRLAVAADPGAVQIAAVALGALPVFWLGRRHLGSERTAALLALAYLAYPWITCRRWTRSIR